MREEGERGGEEERECEEEREKEGTQLELSLMQLLLRIPPWHLLLLGSKKPATPPKPRTAKTGTPTRAKATTLLVR